MRTGDLPTLPLRPLWEAADFVRRLRRIMRFGRFSRAPLKLLRLELNEDALGCDWVARPPDEWDADMTPSERDRTASLQALSDAMCIRELVLATFPLVARAVLRAFHFSGREPRDLIVVGMVSRESPYDYRVSSLAMRAKLYGFHFCLEEGILMPLGVKVEEETRIGRELSPLT